MMRKTICRTMATSKINAFKLEVVDGKPEAKALDPVIVMGKAKEKDALKALKDKFGTLNGITIGSIEISEDTYEISVDDFVKYAKKVTNGSEASENKSDDSEASEN